MIDPTAPDQIQEAYQEYRESSQTEADLDQLEDQLTGIYGDRLAYMAQNCEQYGLPPQIAFYDHTQYDRQCHILVIPAPIKNGKYVRPSQAYNLSEDSLEGYSWPNYLRLDF